MTAVMQPFFASTAAACFLVRVLAFEGRYKGNEALTSFLWSLPVDEESLLPVRETSAVSL